MTVGELIERLEEFDSDQEVCIGMYQRYGSNFTYDICDELEENAMSSFYGDVQHNVVMLIKGSQSGTIRSNDEDDEDDEEDEE